MVKNSVNTIKKFLPRALECPNYCTWVPSGGTKQRVVSHSLESPSFSLLKVWIFWKVGVSLHPVNNVMNFKNFENYGFLWLRNVMVVYSIIAIRTIYSGLQKPCHMDIVSWHVYNIAPYIRFPDISDFLQIVLCSLSVCYYICIVWLSDIDIITDYLVKKIFVHKALRCLVKHWRLPSNNSLNFDLFFVWNAIFFRHFPIFEWNALVKQYIKM